MVFYFEVVADFFTKSTLGSYAPGPKLMLKFSLPSGLLLMVIPFLVRPGSKMDGIAYFPGPGLSSPNPTSWLRLPLPNFVPTELDFGIGYYPGPGKFCLSFAFKASRPALGKEF